MRSAYVRRLGAVVCRTGTRSLSAPPQKPPPPPSPAEIAKMVEVSEAKVTKIREGAMKTVQPPAVADVPDLPTYLPSDVKEIRVLNDQPENQRARKVTIRQNAQTAMQSGQAKSYAWTITWPNQERWSNPLMGWTSSADPLSNMTMFFDSPEEAARFATRQGWPYEIEAPINRHHPLGTKKYAHNFLPEDVENTLKKEGVKTKQFKHPGGNASHWFQSLTFHGDGECEQHGPTGAATKAAKK